jgi:hypothetical protein
LRYGRGKFGDFITMQESEILNNIIKEAINLDTLSHIFGKKRTDNFIEIQQIEIKYNYRIEVNTEYRIKGTDYVTRPYDGSSFYGINSELEISKPSSFVKEKHSYRINGTQKIKECYSCSGKGEVTCPTCDGRGWSPLGSEDAKKTL